MWSVRAGANDGAIIVQFHARGELVLVRPDGTTDIHYQPMPGDVLRLPAVRR
jgi:hypothetical protein